MNDSSVLLLTDIVDSTKVTEELGDEGAALLWESHDRRARSLLAQWRGREIDKSDGMLVLFGSVDDAVGFALKYHESLRGLEPAISARAAVHTGPVLLRHNPAPDVALGAKPLEVDGIAKPLVARLMGIAQGGQTVLSAAALDGMGAAARAMLDAHPWGHWQLKGIHDPVLVYGVGLDATAPAVDTPKAWRVGKRGDIWLPVRTIRHTLPAERDGFVGRAAALMQLTEAFDSGARLVSVLGMGGIGKTRLAQRYGWLRLGDYPGGVWFCDLSAARTIEGIAHAVASGLEMPVAGRDPILQIGHALAGRGDCLLIVDNFEQLTPLAQSCLGRWLDKAATARILVTTREVLGISGEQSLPLDPLSIDESEHLFLRRSHAATGQAPPDTDRPSIRALARMLDGLPLAIELAASRSRVMSAATMLERIGRRFELLVAPGIRRDRQTALRATLDWSWELLSSDERTALAALSAFEAGFPLQAGEAVVSSDPPGVQPLDLIQALLQKSLLRRTSGQRFDLLPTVQEYAAARLLESGLAPGVHLRHAAHYARLSDAMATREHDADADNLVVATRRSLSVARLDLAFGALVGAWAVLKRIGPIRVAAELAKDVARRADEAGHAAAEALLIAGRADCALGRAADAVESLQRGLSASAGQSSLSARIHCALAESLGHLGQTEGAEQHLAQALVLSQGSGDRRVLLETLNERGAWLMHSSRLIEARQCYDQAHALAVAVGDLRWQGGLLGNMGAIEHAMGNQDAARTHYEAALRHAQSSGDRRWEGNTRCNLGLLLQQAGRVADAQAQVEPALLTARHLGIRKLESTVLCNLGLLLDAQDRRAEAAQHYEAAAGVAVDSGDLRTEGQAQGYLGLARAHLSQQALADAAFATGAERLMRARDALSLGLLYCLQAEAAVLNDRHEVFRKAIERASESLRECDAGQESELTHRIAELRTAAASSV